MTDEDIKAIRGRTEPNRVGGFPHPQVTRDDVVKLCDALEQARAELAEARKRNRELGDALLREQKAHDKFRRVQATANEVIEAARKMSDAYKAVDDGTVTHEIEFQFDNAWERLRELLVKYDARKQRGTP